MKKKKKKKKKRKKKRGMSPKKRALAELKENKKCARQEKFDLDAKVKSASQKLKSLETKKSGIEARMRAVCIQGRNEYSKGAIQQDFARYVAPSHQRRDFESKSPKPYSILPPADWTGTESFAVA
jgi:hypothetical protein